MLKIDFLPAFDEGQSFTGVGEHIFDLPREVFRVTELEEDEGVLAEVVLNPRGARRDHGLTQRKILENARWRVDLGEKTALIRNDPDIAFTDCANDVLHSAR